MSRTLTSAHRVEALPAPDVEIAAWSAPWARLLPLWRHAVWLLVLFALSAIAVGVRIDVQRTQKEIERNAYMQREALVLNERLRLETDARRRAVAMEAAAARLGVVPDVRLVHVQARP